MRQGNPLYWEIPYTGKSLKQGNPLYMEIPYKGKSLMLCPHSGHLVPLPVPYIIYIYIYTIDIHISLVMISLSLSLSLYIYIYIYIYILYTCNTYSPGPPGVLEAGRRGGSARPRGRCPARVSNYIIDVKLHYGMIDYTIISLY